MQQTSIPLTQAQGPAGQHAEYELEQTLDQDLDPLVAHAADRIAYALNDLKRTLDERDGVASATLTGTFQLVSGSQNFNVTIATSDAREDPVTVDAKLGRRDPSQTTAQTSSSATADGHDGARKRRRVDEDAETSQADRDANATQNNDDLPVVPDEELLAVITKLRSSSNPESIQGLRSLIHDLHKTWRAHQRPAPQYNPSSLSSAAARAQQQQQQDPQSSSFPRPSTDVPTGTSTPSNPPSPSSPESVPELLKQQRELLSKQIQWVEECRRVATSLSDQRTETWRTTSAAFHDTNRVDRERFQHRILSESGVHTHMLNQILAEVRAINLQTQSMKWETPASFGGPSGPSAQQGPAVGAVTYPAPPPPKIPPRFPGALPTLPSNSAAGSGSATTSVSKSAREAQMRRTSSSVQQNGREAQNGG